jgi:addiction module HigA family antidote
VIPTVPTKRLPYEPDYVVAPGETLLDLLADKAMSQAELARRTGLSPKHINQIAKGAASITADTATRFERALGVRAGIWLSLQATYEAGSFRQTESRQLEAEVGWLAQIPLAELIRRGHVRRRRHPVEQLREVLNFFGVANKEAFAALWNETAAFRQSRAFDSDPGSVAAWLRIGEIEAARINSAPYDKDRFVEALRQARQLTLIREPDVFLSELKDICARAGVAVVVVKETPKARVFGAARWLGAEKALIQLSFRYKSNDVFWFTFFHEGRHVLQEIKRQTILEGKDTEEDELERDADQFAAELLIPSAYRRRLHDIETLADARELADELGIAVGIVVGRLHFLELKPYSWGSNLKWRYEFS